MNPSLYYGDLRRVGASILVLAVAAAIRIPHYDIAWFGIDQVYFLSEARRILAGATDVVGPLSSGLNLLGPLYSYLLAGLLWIRNDGGFLALFGAVGEVAAAWFVFDATRRVAGTTAGVVAGIAYAASPILVLSTRLIWNPTLLPLMVAVGWWMAVRYAEKSTFARLAGAALAAGLMLPLHPTGIFPAAGVALAVLLTRVPTIPQLAAATVVGVLPILPTLVRMRSSAGDVNTLGSQLVAQSDFLAAIPSLLSLLFAFPIRLFGEDGSASAATASLYVFGAIAVAGAVRGIWRPSPFRGIWIALTLSSGLYVLAAAVYSGALTFYYLLALVPPLCLAGGAALAGLPHRLQRPAAALMIAIAVPQLVFVYRYDRHAIATGLLRIDAQKVFLRRPPGEAFSLTMRTVRATSRTLAAHGLDGATALMSVHGIYGELWRESGAEFMPWAAAPSVSRTQQFAIVQAGRVCESNATGTLTWRAANRALAGWETAAFAETGYFDLQLPRRTEAPSLSADNPRFAPWQSGRVVLRGRYTVQAPGGKRLLAITTHSPAGAPVSLTEVFVNGAAVTPSKARVMYGIYLNQEWLIDLTDRVTAGDNLIALGFAGTGNAFDLDVFEVPCTDSEFYF